MPARKTPIGFKDKHYDAEQIMGMFSVSLTKAYDIIHQCAAFGPVVKLGGALRVSETALTRWYETHTIHHELPPETPLDIKLLRMSETQQTPPRRGRPRGGIPYYEVQL